MFDIEYKGGNSVLISSKKVTVAIDPSIESLGLKNPKLKDAIELLTEERFRVDDPDVRLVIDGPGEYEVADFAIRGVAASRYIDDEKEEKRSTLYRLEHADISVAIVGNIAAKLDEEQLEALGIVDILIIPVGGATTLDASSATAIVRLIEPKVVVPVHYASAGLSYEMPQESVETFTKELGAPVESVSKLKVKSSTLPQSLTVYVLERV